ncbi:MAG: sugar phosphate isomerase/epimerase [Ruminococcaceae bacterium]|nr:sugar phosphate isomerase/epimerase [Oscillospiraceae bacterium]
MKSAVSAWSFQRLISEGKHTHFSIIEKAKEYGFEAIEFIDLYVPEGKTELEFAKEIKAEADRVGIEISCYAVYADLLNGCDGDIDKEIERLCRKVDIAEVLGAKLLRHDITPHPPKGYLGYTNLLPRFVKAARAITEYAEAKGIRTCTENHGFFSQDSERIVSLVNATERENFGLLVDIGNFMGAGEEPAVAVGRCATYAFNVHLKDNLIKSGNEEQPEGFHLNRIGNYVRGTVLGHGVVPIMQCVKALKRVGYDGYLTLEFEGLEDCEFGIKAGLTYINKIIKALG